MAVDCVFATCGAIPELDPDDRRVLAELERRGFSTGICVWSRADVDWSAVRLCVVRSTWDYHTSYSEFVDWVERAARLTVIRNDPTLLLWNADKAYLFELQAGGVPIVPTVRVERHERVSLVEIAAELAWTEVVVKPSRGAAAHDVMRVRMDESRSAGGQAHLDRLTETQAALVQPYLRGVAGYGERSLVFFEGRYSHAAQKKPFDTIWVVDGSESAAVTATTAEIDVAAGAIAALPSVPLYARVDLLPGDDGTMYVSEVELIEPGLYVGAHASAASAFADAIERELHTVA